LKVRLKKLRILKRAGCDAFLPSNRVDSRKLLRWLLQNSDQDRNVDGHDLESSRSRLALARATKLEREMKLNEGDHIAATHVFAVLVTALNRIKTISSGQTDDYCLMVQGVNIHDRNELRYQREKQAEALEVAIDHARATALKELGTGPDGGLTLIGQFLEAGKELRAAADAAWKRLHASVPKEYCEHFNQWMESAFEPITKKADKLK
jgi:hypothetical protein